MLFLHYSLLVSASAGLLAGLALAALRSLVIRTNELTPSAYNITYDVYHTVYRGTEQYTDDIEHENSENGTHLSIMDDNALHNDDDSIGKLMKDRVRVLCWIMTSPSTLWKKAIHVKKTWARRCNIALFMSDETDLDFPAIGLGTDSGRQHLTAKTMTAFGYIYKHHINDADWFLKADDDTYVIVENLRYMLSAHAPSDPIYFGHHFHVIVKQGYNSGGAGYVLSKEALRRFGERSEDLCAKDQGAEDVEMGRCLEKLQVDNGDSRDRLNRSRFHCFPPALHFSGNYPSWYYKYDAFGAQKGITSVSDYPVSFHYVSPNLMYELEYLFYHLNVYGIDRGLQSLNRLTEGQHQLDSNRTTEGRT